MTPTLSETHYRMPKWAFPVAMVSCAVLALPYWLEVSNCRYQFLAFLSCAGVVFMGVEPLFKWEDRLPHILSVCVAGVSAFIWAVLTDWVASCALLVVMAVLTLMYTNNWVKTYWVLVVELGLFVLIYSMLLFT